MVKIQRENLKTVKEFIVFASNIIGHEFKRKLKALLKCLTIDMYATLMNVTCIALNLH